MKSLTLAALVTTFCGACIGASQAVIFDRKVDLDGDGKPDHIIARVLRGQDQGDLVIDVSGAEYRGAYFAAEGDRPEISIVSLLRGNAQSEILVKTLGAVDCNYKLLEYGSRKIWEILDLNSSHCLFEPTIRGDGQVSMGAWEGFWTRTQVFVRDERLSGRLRLNQPPLEPVGIDTVTSGPVEGSKEGSPSAVTEFPAGTRVKIVSFDSNRRLYLIQAEGRDRYWIDVTPEGFSRLPWAN